MVCETEIVLSLLFKEMDENVEECGRSCRNRKRQVDPSCCPVCSITIRSSEVDQHLTMEVDRLTKLSVKNKKNARCQHTEMTDSNLRSKGWETYQKIKANRQVRQKVKSKKRKNDETICPVCNETTSEDISLHVEMCLRKNEHNNESGMIRLIS